VSMILWISAIACIGLAAWSTKKRLDILCIVACLVGLLLVCEATNHERNSTYSTCSEVK
jgi:hypothetical protein